MSQGGKYASKSNRGYRQVESLITPAQLRKKYLFGINIEDKDGNKLPDSILQDYINNAVSMLEHYLDLAIMPRCKVEYKDYHSNDYFAWGYLQLNEFPIVEMTKFSAVYLKDENGEDEEVLDIPKSWWRIDCDTGILYLVPNNTFPARLAANQHGNWFPEFFRRHGFVPHMWKLEYKYGFEDGKIPVLINAAIGLIASIYALNIAGDLILGAGIAGSSLSLDGLSQSIQTTSSAENHSYSAKLKEYQNQLFGTRKDDPNSIVRILKDYYKGATINIV